MYNYKTIFNKGKVEYEVNKSLFICNIAPVYSVEEAQEFINSIKKEHKDATHNCWSYILFENQHHQKANDDGEPQGTAGIPILEVLKKNDLTNVVAVVTRYFGGIKLGTGGLIRAYGKAVSLAVSELKIAEYKIRQNYNLQIDYSLLGLVENFLNSSNIAIHSKDFSNVVDIKISLPIEDASFIDKLLDYVNGKINIEKLEMALSPVLVH